MVKGGPGGFRHLCSLSLPHVGGCHCEVPTQTLCSHLVFHLASYLPQWLCRSAGCGGGQRPPCPFTPYSQRVLRGCMLLAGQGCCVQCWEAEGRNVSDDRASCFSHIRFGTDRFGGGDSCAHLSPRCLRRPCDPRVNTAAF
jgi:hypothetical protein